MRASLRASTLLAFTLLHKREGTRSAMATHAQTTRPAAATELAFVFSRPMFLSFPRNAEMTTAKAARDVSPLASSLSLPPHLAAASTRRTPLGAAASAETRKRTRTRTLLEPVRIDGGDGRCDRAPVVRMMASPKPPSRRGSSSAVSTTAAAPAAAAASSSRTASAPAAAADAAAPSADVPAAVSSAVTVASSAPSYFPAPTSCVAATAANRDRASSSGGDVGSGGMAAAATVAKRKNTGAAGGRVVGRRDKPRQLWGMSARQVKARRTGGRAFFIVCDAESVTHPELLDCINIVEELGTRDVGMIYADWRVTPAWKSYLYQRSKADRFETAQRDPLPPGSNPLGGDTMTVDVMNVALSKAYEKHEFCLVSSDNSMAELAGRLRGEGRVVRGGGRRQAPEAFLENCDAFMYIDPANRYELLMDEGLVISVALCIALAAARQEKCDWVRMKTIVKSLHAWDLGLEEPNWYGYSDYGDMVEVMEVYVQGVQDTSGEVVVRVPPKPAKEVPRGLEEVAMYLYSKWAAFTEDPKMNDILLACIPACVQAVAVSRAEMKAAVKRFQRQGFAER